MIYNQTEFEWQRGATMAYTYSNHLVDTSALLIHRALYNRIRGKLRTPFAVQGKWYSSTGVLITVYSSLLFKLFLYTTRYHIHWIFFNIFVLKIFKGCYTIKENLVIWHFSIFSTCSAVSRSRSRHFFLFRIRNHYYDTESGYPSFWRKGSRSVR